jgi:hypothetical protein
MHKPRSNKLIYAFFSWFISLLVKRDFKRFNFNDVDLNRDKAVLLLSNHFSWWDAFLLFYLNKIYLKRNFYIMVSEVNYRKIWFIKYMGAFSIKANSKSVLETLAFAGNLLNDPNNLVVIFPQGRLYSNHVEDIKFERGVWKLINFSNKSFQYLFVSVFVDYFEFRKPSVSCYLQHSNSSNYNSIELVGKAFNDHYQTSRHQQNRIIV